MTENSHILIVTTRTELTKISKEFTKNFINKIIIVILFLKNIICDNFFFPKMQFQ